MFDYDVNYGTLRVYKNGALVGEADCLEFDDIHRVLDDIIFANC